jgi:pimeloyl-ACP methyl ester carboxylesterase
LAVNVPRFEAAKCPFQLGKDQEEGKTVRCGYVVVPELHGQPNGKTLRLATIIFKAISDAPAPEPVVFLNGRPGSDAQGLVSMMAGPFYRSYAAKNDVIFFDQRGTGFSVPSLACPEVREQLLKAYSQNLTTSQETALLLDTMNKCHDQLVAQGINLEAYNSRENAADLEDLRTALGYTRLNLQGTSYGSRLALEMLRDFPQSVRSAVLDSLVPPQVNLYEDEALSADRAFNLLFQTCAADSDCNKSYPDLKGTFARTVAQLNQKPVTVRVQDPKDGKNYDVLVTGDRFVAAVARTFYVTGYLPYLPSIITQASAGSSRALNLVITNLLFGADLAYGMHFAVQCSEEVPFNKAAAVAAALQKVQPELRGAYSGLSGLFTLCQGWGIKAAPARENEAVRSNIPALLVAGRFDPVTPPDYAKLVGQTLTNNFYLEVPYGGHGSSISLGQCEIQVVLAFYANPSQPPDSSCITGQKLRFTMLPGAINGITPTAAATPAALAPGGKKLDVPLYPAANVLPLNPDLQQQLTLNLGQQFKDSSFLAFVSKDEPGKVVDYYTQQLGKQGYITQPDYNQSADQGFVKSQVAGFSRDNTVVIISATGPIDEATLSVITLQAPDLTDKLKVGDTLVIMVGGITK